MYFSVFPSLYYLACSLVIRSITSSHADAVRQYSFPFLTLSVLHSFYPSLYNTHLHHDTLYRTYLAISIFTLSSHFLFLAKEDELFVGVSIVSIDN